MGFASLIAVADRSASLVLGESIVYTPSVGDPVTVNAIYDTRHMRVTPGSVSDRVTSFVPAVWVRIADLPGDPGDDPGATITAGGVVYRVKELVPDVCGGLLIYLLRVNP
jgi:hypothetical protein